MGRPFVLGALLALTLFVGTSALAYTGQLSYGTGLDASGTWAVSGTYLWWEVTPTTGGWLYHYKLSAPSDVSHFIIEVSQGFAYADVQNLQVLQGSVGPIEIDDYNGSQPGNPGMPGTVHGLKFDETQGEPLEFTFVSPRVPVWGDFYAKGGQKAVWNTGFAIADPTDAASDGSILNHVLVPDTATVPEPASLAALAMGLAGALIRRKRG